METVAFLLLVGLLVWFFKKARAAGKAEAGSRPGREQGPDTRTDRRDLPSDAEGLDVLYRFNGHPVELSYVDASGDPTRRRVDLDAVLGEPAEGLARPYRIRTVTGHCHLREARRSFRIDRIQELVDMENGEVLSREADNGQYHLWRFFADRVDGRPPTEPDRTLFEGELPAMRLTLQDGDVFEGKVERLERKNGRLQATGTFTRVAGKRKWTGRKSLSEKDVIQVQHVDEAESYAGIEAYVTARVTRT